MIIINQPHYSPFFSILAAVCVCSPLGWISDALHPIKLCPVDTRSSCAAKCAGFHFPHPSSATTYSLWSGTAFSCVPSLHLPAWNVSFIHPNISTSGASPSPSLHLYSDPSVLRITPALYHIFWEGLWHSFPQSLVGKHQWQRPLVFTFSKRMLRDEVQYHTGTFKLLSFPQIVLSSKRVQL